jgi:DNA-binding response OmpR family regulator
MADASPRGRDRSRPRILLAEDDPIVAAIVQQKLQRRRRMSVRHFPDGLEALEAAQAAAGSEPFDLFILDVSLPGLDGFALLARLREHPELKSVPVMMLTGKNKDEDVHRGLDLGADDYLIKPFLPYEVLTRVEKLLASAR